MSLVLVNEGTHVLPGDVLYATASCTGGHVDGASARTASQAGDEAAAVVGGQGAESRHCLRRCRDADAPTSLESRVVAVRSGYVHWSEDGRVVSVVRQRTAVGLSASSSAPATTHVPISPSDLTAADATTAASSSGMMGPTAGETTTSGASASAEQASLGAAPGDTVYVRITRITKLFASGDVLAIRGKWCCSKLGNFSGFRGMLRAEDIKPFKPTKDRLMPDAPEESMRPGDVLVAVVISQADAKVFQLSTIPDHCGVVESTMPHHYAGSGSGVAQQDDAPQSGEEEAAVLPSVRPTRRVALQPIAFKRDAMLHPVSGAYVKKWAPLVK